jgi:UPF0042 nucleotide-binding protein
VNVVVVTGMSGAGKTTALHALEDAGFLAVDNIPAKLWPSLVAEVHAAGIEELAIGIDVRGQPFVADAPAAIDTIQGLGHEVFVVFLDARDDTLVKRFAHTRRTHPLDAGSLSDELTRERDALNPVRLRADLLLDTTLLTVRDLRQRIQRLAGDDRFQLRLLSFGYKRGIPTDVDAILDVRGLKNPYYDDRLRSLPGTDARVQAYVMEDGGFDRYVPLRDMARGLTQSAQTTGRASYTVAIGCTGGQHRSVAIAERLAHDLADVFAVQVHHRDVQEALKEHAPEANEDTT